MSEHELDVIISQFGVSEPVFKLIISNGELRFDTKDEYIPPTSTDPVYMRVRETYCETLDIKGKCFKANTDSGRAYSNILKTVTEFALCASPLKNPKQSSLHKWLNSVSTEYHNPSSVGFIGLYRYICDNDLIGTQDKTNPRTKNVLAVLELMREKYEVK